ncbi:MAG: hypothetical protein Q4F34_08010, partial [Prevotellaceae bacterium]|nr:hypothetical protein [Prevotellaceae bacterium]
MKKILLLLCTIFTIATANAEGAYYNLPDGAFATSVTATGYLAPNVYMPYSSTAYTWASTTGAGTWTVGETTVATDKETYNASYKIGYYSNMPMLTVGEATYQYGS